MFAAFCISEEDPNQYDNVIQTDLSACSQISCHVARSLSCSPVGDLDDHNDHVDDDDHQNDHEDDHDDNNHDDHYDHGDNDDNNDHGNHDDDKDDDPDEKDKDDNHASLGEGGGDGNDVGDDHFDKEHNHYG